MKIWIFEIGEPLPLEGSVRLHRYGQFSKFLADKGHDVTWWTSSFSHAPKKHFSEKDQDFPHGKATLRVICGLGYPRNVSLARIRHNKHFAQRISELMPKYDRPDLIIAPVPTIESAFAALEFAKSKNIPIVTDIRDHWPDELRDLAPKLLRTLAQLALFRSYQKMSYLCQNVTGIMGTSENELGFGLRFAKRDKSKNDLLFPHGYTPAIISSEKLNEAHSWCEQIGIKKENFNICYFGTMGKFFDLETVIGCARTLRDQKIRFILAGDGSEKKKFMSLAQGLDNVIFPGWVDQPKIAAIMQRSKVGIAPYRLGTKMSLPNKPFEYMSGKLAILSSIQGELTPILVNDKCGLTYKADSTEDLRHAVFKLVNDANLTATMGENGYRVFTERFSTEKVFAQAERHLCQVVQ